MPGTTKTECVFDDIKTPKIKPEQMSRATMWDVGSCIVSTELATWEATVLPALRRAMKPHPELHGASITLEGQIGETFEVKLHAKGQDWDRTAKIRRGPLVAHIEGDCLIFADAAAAEARKAHASAEAQGDPDHAARAMAAEMLAPRSEPLPAATIEHESPPCAAVSKSERTPLPSGWSWREHCFVSGPGGAFAFVLVAPESNPGRIETHDNKPAPPAIHNALIIEAARLGLVCHEKPALAPEGYTFKVDADGDVKAEDHYGHVRYYWSAALRVELQYQRSNTDPERWGGWEPARQWAAYLLGEVAPPLREEGAAS